MTYYSSQGLVSIKFINFYTFISRFIKNAI